jgi:TRAP-type transport system large permease protein
MGVVKLHSLKYDLPKREEKIEINEATKIVSNASLAILLPVIILGGILLGIVSPTEATVVAAFYAAFIAVFICLNRFEITIHLYLYGAPSFI